MDTPTNERSNDDKINVTIVRLGQQNGEDRNTVHIAKDSTVADAFHEARLNFESYAGSVFCDGFEAQADLTVHDGDVLAIMSSKVDAGTK